MQSTTSPLTRYRLQLWMARVLRLARYPSIYKSAHSLVLRALVIIMDGKAAWEEILILDYYSSAVAVA